MVSLRDARLIAFVGIAACGGGGSSDGSSTSSEGDTSMSTAPATSEASTTVDTSGVADSSSGSGMPSSSSEESSGTTGEPVMPQVLLPRASIVADELAVLVNDADPQSVAVAEYYVDARQIP